MAAGKRNKKRGNPPTQPNSPPPTMNQDDDNLMNDLLAQLESRDQTVQQESAAILNDMHLDDKAEKIEATPRQDARSRFQARQARKVAKLAQSYNEDDPEREAQLEREAKDEVDGINHACKELGLQVCEINPDGHCLFSAIADQLCILGILPPNQANYATVRAVAANFIHSHPNDFIPFLPSSGGEDTVGAHDAGIMTKAQFDNYCMAMRDTAIWGGEPEIVALSRAYQVPIYVVQSGKPTLVKHAPHGDSDRVERNSPIVWISYHRRLYGLGEHYNSLRPLQVLR